MTANFTLSNDAERDVIDIFLYTLEKYGEPQADLYIDALYDRFTQIMAEPSLGRDFGHIYRGALRTNHSAHAIYYRQSDRGIFILRILHQKMDPARHLDSSGK